MMKRLLLLASTILISAATVNAANTENDYSGASTGNVLTTTNWSLGHVPTVSEDATFPSAAATGIRTLSGNNGITVGSIDVLNTNTITIRNGTNGTTSTITLGGAGNLGNGVSGTAADLLYAVTSGTLNLNTGAGATALMNVVLGQSGNFDSVGTGLINVATAISDGGNNFAINKTGTGVLTLGGANTFGGGLTISGGTVNLNTATAPGTGTLTINGGTIQNASGAAITLSNNNAQTWGGDFSIAVGSGTNALNFGTGAITMTGSRVITVNGATNTATIGGAISDGGNSYSLTKGTGGAGVLFLTGNSTYSGGTTIGGGTISVANIGNAGASGNLGTGAINLGSGTTSGATLAYTGAGETTNKQFNLSGTTGGGIIDTTGAAGGLVITSNIGATGAGTKTLTLRGNASGNAINGNIVDNSATNLTRLSIGSGSWTIGGAANTFSGGTTITGGTVTVTNNGGLGTGNVSLTAGTLILGTGGVGQQYISNTATFSIVNGVVVNLNYSGTDVVNALVVDNNSVAPGIYSAATTNPDGIFTGTGTITVLTQIPEPATYMLMGFGVLLCAQTFRRKRS